MPRASARRPLGQLGPIVIHPSTTRRVGPVPVLVLAVLRSALELVFGHANTIAAEASVIFKIRPGHWVVVFANAHEPAKRDHGIRHFAADLVNHNALKASDLLVVRPVEGGAFDLVAADQGHGLTAIINGRSQGP